MPPLLNKASIIFAINSLCAVLLALLIGFWLDLPRPYWAVLTVFIISQPLTGSVRSKALFRVIGTFLGAGFAVLVVPVFVDAPLLLSLALAIWVGGCLGVSLLDRTPRAYVLMLAGYTATLVAFPTVDHPDLIFDVAVSRVEEITLGILCATATHSLFFPRSLGLALRQRLITWVRDADALALCVLRGATEDELETDYRKLATAATDIRVLSVLLPFDTSHLRHTSGVVRAIHQRLLVLIPVLSGAYDRLRGLGLEVNAEGVDTTEMMREIADWITSGADQTRALPLLERLAVLRSAVISPDWPALLRESLFSRLHDLVTNLGEAHILLGQLENPPQALPLNLAEAVAHEGARPTHQDVGLAVTSGLSAAITIMLTCGVWIWTGWPEGTVAAAIAGVFCALFASLDDPAPPIVAFGIFSGIAIPIAGLFQFAVLPAIDGFVMLSVVLAPPILLGSIAMTRPKTALPGLAFLLGFSSSLALQETFSADFASFLNINFAQYVSLFIALVVTRTMRSLSVEAAARRLLVRTWRTLASIARLETRPDLLSLAALMVDRLGLLAPKLAAFGPHARATGIAALSDLRVGMNLAHLQLSKRVLDPAQQAAVTRVLTQIGGYFADRAAGRANEPGPEVLVALDACLAATAASAEDRTGVTSLVGLRRNLFPDAPAFASSLPSRSA